MYAAALGVLEVEETLTPTKEVQVPYLYVMQTVATVSV
jgi:hypothetical protein